MKDIRGRGENPVAAKSRLLPEFGEDTPLERITDERVNEYRSRVFTEGVVSRRTAQKMLGFMHAIYKRTRFLKWVRINPPTQHAYGRRGGRHSEVRQRPLGSAHG
jgi:hypothetical protein